MVFLKIYVLLIGVTVMMHKYTEAQVFPEISAETEGKIVWRNEGAADRNKFSELTEVVDKMIPS